MVWQWSRQDDRGLARYVTAEATQELAVGKSRFDLAKNPAGRRQLIEMLYQALSEKNICYDLEAYHPAAALQMIRTPAEVLKAPQVGTCLDLAALFCGLCLGNELLPVLIVLDGHALAAVSLTHGLRDWDSYRPEREWFAEGPLTDPAKLRERIDRGEMLALECTGFAHSKSLGQAGKDPYPESVGRTAEGRLPFVRALEAGRAQLDEKRRLFCFALDIAVAHYAWRIEPSDYEWARGVEYGIIQMFDLLRGQMPSRDDQRRRLAVKWVGELYGTVHAWNLVFIRFLKTYPGFRESVDPGDYREFLIKLSEYKTGLDERSPTVKYELCEPLHRLYDRFDNDFAYLQDKDPKRFQDLKGIVTNAYKGEDDVLHLAGSIIWDVQREFEVGYSGDIAGAPLCEDLHRWHAANHNKICKIIMDYERRSNEAVYKLAFIARDAGLNFSVMDDYAQNIADGVSAATNNTKK